MKQKIQFKKLILTFLGCGLMLFLTLPRYQGAFLVFFLPLLIPLFIYNFYRIWRKKEERRTRWARVAVWAIGILTVVSVNGYYETRSRSMANHLAGEITRYRQDRGEYPSRLEDLGISLPEYRRHYGIYYSRKEGAPDFGYFIPYLIATSYRYDFETSRWQYTAD